MVKRVFVLISLVVAILVIVGNAFAQGKTSKASIPEPSLGPEWKLVFTDSSGGTTYVNTRRITYLPKGIVKARELWVPRGEMRRTLVNDLKKTLLSEGTDPNNAERFWYVIYLDKVNCKTHQIAGLEGIYYSFEKAVLVHESVPFQYQKWIDIIPGSPGEAVENYVCNEAPPSIPAQYKQTIPEPSLSSNWKFIGRDSNGTTLYFNARKITYLPKGIVEVWKLMVPRGEVRKTFVNIFKNHLLWYIKGLDKINCKTHQYAMLELTAYSFGKAVLDDESFQREKWNYIPPGSPEGVVEKRVCNETPSSIPAQYKQTIPNPPLGPKWKLVGRNSNDGSTLYFNTKRITHLPKGIVKVWTLVVPRGETRRKLVNGLKKYFLFKGKDPNNVERLWYFIELDKLNCNTNQYAQLEDIAYSFEKTVLLSPSYQHEKWRNIIPGSADEAVEKYACKEYKGEK